MKTEKKNERVNEALGKHVREAWAHKAGADDKAVNELRVVYSEEDVAEKMEQKKGKAQTEEITDLQAAMMPEMVDFYSSPNQGNWNWNALL